MIGRRSLLAAVTVLGPATGLTAGGKSKAKNLGSAQECITWFESLANSIVRLRVANSVELDRKDPLKLNVKYAFGTAFFVKEGGLLITAAHSISDWKTPPAEHREISVMSRSANRFLPTELVAQDTHTDLALLRVNMRGFPEAQALSLSGKKKVALHDRVYALGIRGKAAENLFELMMVMGQVTEPGANLNEVLKNSGRSASVAWLAITAMVMEGHSGGPVLDQDGDVTGVVVGIKEVRGEWRDFSLVAPVENVKNLILRGAAAKSES